jgi:hypothetical protein
MEHRGRADQLALTERPERPIREERRHMP